MDANVQPPNSDLSAFTVSPADGMRGFDSPGDSGYHEIMETAIVVDTEILDLAMQTAAGLPQRVIVEDALRLFATRNRQDDARKYRGRLQWEGDLDELRTAKWSS